MHVSYAQLTDLTGLAYRTLKSKMEAAGIGPIVGRTGQSGANLWESKDALPVLYAKTTSPASGGEDCVIDYNVEKARAEKARADKLELANAEKRGELLDAASVVEKWSTEVINAKTKLLSIPSKVSVLIEDDEERRRIFADVNELIRDILTELGQGGVNPS